jgi:orotate phosphoribosyltransferase
VIRSFVSVSQIDGSVLEPSLERLKRDIETYCITRKSSDVSIISPNGQLQSWLIDLRAIFTRKGAVEIIADIFWEQFRAYQQFQLAGVETAGIPLLMAILLRAPAERDQINAIVIRKDRKPHGLGKTIEGTASQDPVILVDDNFNSGSSAEKARVVLEQAGLKVAEMFVVTDYRQSAGRRWSNTTGIKVRSLFSPNDFGLDVSERTATRMQSYQPVWSKILMGGKPFHIVPKSAPRLIGDRIYRGCDAGKMHASRALYRQPTILMLDEATSHLDLENERDVSSMLLELGMTQIIIAHRPETIAKADRILDIREINRGATDAVAPLVIKAMQTGDSYVPSGSTARARDAIISPSDVLEARPPALKS